MTCLDLAASRRSMTENEDTTDLFELGLDEFDVIALARAREPVSNLITPHSFLIYALKDPRDGHVKYVGRSVRGLQRPRQHWLTASMGWIAELKAAGTDMIIDVLEVCSNRTSLEWAETKWIAEAIRLGWPITNQKRGGRDGGTYISAATASKLSKAKKGVPRDPASIVKRPDVAARNKTPEMIEHRRETMKKIWEKRKATKSGGP